MPERRQHLFLGRLAVAFVAAPLVVTVLTFWFFPISYLALIFGGPYYLIIGAPLTFWYAGRYGVRLLPVLLLALIATLGTWPIAAALAWSSDNWEAMEAFPAFLTFAAGFAGAWSATFVGLYRLLTLR